MLWENSSDFEEVYDGCECSSLNTNPFTSMDQPPRTPDRVNNGRARTNLRINLSSMYDENSISHEKENLSVEDVSFYSENSPRPCSLSPCMGTSSSLSPENSPSRLRITQENETLIVQRQQMDEYDASSMDSGYGTSYSHIVNDDPHRKHGFKFVEPCGVPPRRSEASPKTNICNSPRNTFKIYNNSSPSSIEIMMDDDYIELFEMESLDDVNSLPNNLNNLISGNIVMTRTTPEVKRPLVRRCLSLNETETSSVKTNLFATNTVALTSPVLKTIFENGKSFSPRMENGRCFKRPEAPSETPIQNKRYRSESDEIGKENTHLVRRPVLRKSVSMNDAVIMNALAKSCTESDLIGDFSKPYCLPLMDGRHQDLKSISVHTMAKLMCGEFSETVGSFKVIDCRYPYEYEGGHIRNALNLFTQEQIVEELVNSQKELAIVEESNLPKRNILVFHCEFSSERGPKLSRVLRNLDRSRNEYTYPALHYPEVYLLNGGYKDFFSAYSELCEPNDYRPMLHPSYMDSYRHFRAKSKSWNGETKPTNSSNRLLKSRSRLVL